MNGGRIESQAVEGSDPWAMARQGARECTAPDGAHPHTFALRWREREQDGAYRIRIFVCTRVRVTCGQEGRQDARGCGLSWTLPCVEDDPVALDPDPESVHAACARKRGP